MEEPATLIPARPLRLRLPDKTFTQLSGIAAREDRPIERQAERLLREAIELTAGVQPEPVR
jgi:hypothetical protein